MSYATEKQRNFIGRLFDDVSKSSASLSGETDEKAKKIMEPVVEYIVSLKKGNDITKTQASIVIETLIDLNKFIEGSLGIIHCRWKKEGDNWYVVGPEDVVVPGATVTVKSSKGEKEVDIGSVAKTLDGKAYGVPKKVEVSADIAEGIWRNKNGVLIEVYKTRKGFLVGKSIDEESGEKTYLGKKGLENLDYKLSLEEAKEWGRKTGVCCVCGAELTNPESVAAGIGPICSSKSYWN